MKTTGTGIKDRGIGQGSSDTAFSRYREFLICMHVTVREIIIS